MESFESLRSLDVSGGPPGTGRSTSPLPGTSERDFEVDLTRARRSERHAGRRERSEAAGEHRAADQREQRIAQRREAAESRRAEPARKPGAAQAEPGALDHASPVDPSREVAAERASAASDDAATTAQRPGQADAAGGAPEQGTGTAPETPAVPTPVWTPVAALAPIAAPPTSAGSATPATSPAGESGTSIAATSLRGDGSESKDGEDEGGTLPRPDPIATRDAPDAPRAGERARSAPEAPASSGEARAPGAPRSAEAPRAEPPATPPPAPAPEAAEHAAALLRQVRLRFVSGAREATLQLEPARLGRLSIRLELRRGATRAEVVAEEPEALELLARHEPELRAALTDAGFPGVEVELRQAGDGERASTFAPPAAPAPHAPLARALAARRTSITGVDTYA